MTELISGMPVLPLHDGMQVRFEAIHPTTGAAVAGVTVSQAILYATDDEASEAPKFEALPPLLTYAADTAA